MVYFETIVVSILVIKFLVRRHFPPDVDFVYVLRLENFTIYHF